APSTVVSDADGERRMFVAELLKKLRTPGLTGQEVFDRARLDVSRESKGQQVPWVSSSLISEFSFSRNSLSAAPKPGIAPVPGVESKIEMPKMDPVIPSSPPPVAQPSSPAPVARLDPPSPSSPTTPTPVSIPADAQTSIEDLNDKLRNDPRDAA